MKQLSILWMILFISSCEDSKDAVLAKAKKIGMTNPTCVQEEGKFVDLAFCADGRQLIICTEDDGCLVVNLDLESP